MTRDEVINYIEEYFWCDGVFFYSLPEHSEVKHDEGSLRELAESIVRILDDRGVLKCE